MKSILLIAVAFLFFLSCTDNKALPADIFPVSKMKVIVWDMEIADQTAINKYTYKKDSLRMEATGLYQQVFARHKTDKKTFYKSLAYYQSYPDLMKVLFDSVTSYGTRQKNSAYKRAY